MCSRFCPWSSIASAASRPDVRLFLFDIDGTLISSRGVGRHALARALREVYGTHGSIEQYDTRGKTDQRIVVDVLRAAGRSDETIQAGLDACFAAYARELRTLIGTGDCVRTMPGMAEVVRRLSARADALVGLLTGNVAAGAELKLRPTGLWPLFRLGAFGSDHIDRRRLPGVARERARTLLGHELPFDCLTIIGDTPHDVDCARACGAVAVAVATGQFLRGELALQVPDFLFDDFADVDDVVNALTRR
jgi:phosphoglycolate phosphatase-like HAD superfamily hydrolase